MSKELIKRIITSVFLIILLSLVFVYNYLLIITLIIISIITWIEFYGLIVKIFAKNSFKVNFLKVFIKGISLIYLSLFSFLIFDGITETDHNFKINMAYLFSICICSDIGGLFFGKTFKGRKLTRISPNKTISGSIGSFILSMLLAPIFYLYFDQFSMFYNLIFISIIVSLLCQLGDLFISYLKRKAKVKDTGDLLPGHGGVLDRIDGMLFALPLGIIYWKYILILT